MSGGDEDYRSARLWAAAARRLAVPASDDLVFVRRCNEAVAVAWREAESASGWPGRVEAVMAAFADVYGDEAAGLLAAQVEAEPLPGDEDRRAEYVRAEERAFVGHGR